MTFNTAKKKVKKSAHLGNRPFIGHRWALTVVVGVGLEACGVMVMEVVMTRRKWPLLLYYVYKSSLLTITRNKKKKVITYLWRRQCLLGIPRHTVCPLRRPFLSIVLVVETVVVTWCVGVVRVKCSS